MSRTVAQQIAPGVEVATIASDNILNQARCEWCPLSFCSNASCGFIPRRRPTRKTHVRKLPGCRLSISVALRVDDHTLPRRARSESDSGIES